MSSFVTTPGADDANSYTEVSFADELLENQGYTGWAALSNADKETWLRKATASLDRRYGSQWSGCRATSTQALDWPRRGAMVYGFTVGTDEIPTKLKEATSLTAEQMRAGFSFDTTSTPGGSLRSRTDTVGPLTKRRVYAGNGATVTTSRSSLIDEAVSALLGFSGSSVPLVRS